SVSIEYTDRIRSGNGPPTEGAGDVSPPATPARPSQPGLSGPADRSPSSTHSVLSSSRRRARGGGQGPTHRKTVGAFTGPRTGGPFRSPPPPVPPATGRAPAW